MIVLHNINRHGKVYRLEARMRVIRFRNADGLERLDVYALGFEAVQLVHIKGNTYAVTKAANKSVDLVIKDIEARGWIRQPDDPSDGSREEVARWRSTLNDKFVPAPRVEPEPKAKRSARPGAHDTFNLDSIPDA